MDGCEESLLVGRLDGRHVERLVGFKVGKVDGSVVGLDVGCAVA